MLSAYFLTHATTEAKLSTRTFYNSVAINLAEAGVDYAMLDINNSALTTANGWRAATDNAASWVKSFGGTSDANYNLGQGTGTVYVRVDNWTPGTSSTVIVTSCGQVVVPNAAAISRQIVVRVGKRPLQGAGLLSRGAISLGSGSNVSVDAYSSTLGVPNPSTNLSDQVVVAVASLTSDVSVGGATIYGYVATGGMTPTIGTGRIYGPTTPASIKADPARIRTDFSQNIPNPVAPTGTATVVALSSGITLPRPGDTPQANGRYLYSDGGGGISLTGHSTLTINGPVDIIMTGSLSMAGKGAISVASVGGSSPSLGLYATGSVSIAGNGLTNSTNVPSNAYIYGMDTGAVSISGNGTFTGAINAPNSAVSVTGDGTINGAMTAASMSFSGNASFHYDTQLGSVTASPYYAVKSWVELTDRSAGTSPFKRDNRDPFTFL